MQEIKITNSKESALIEIEGTIGIPEAWQFENPEHRVATYEKFRESVRQIELLKASEVVVNIRSTGGDVNDALLIYDALVGLNATIITRCWGYVASAATVIAQAADEGLREISPNALYLVHHSTCSAEGNAQDLGRRIDLLQKTDERLAELYATRSGRDVQFFVDLMSEENGAGRWLSATEAVEAGLADAFVENARAEDEAQVSTDNAPSAGGVMAKVKGLLRRIGEEIGFVDEAAVAAEATKAATAGAVAQKVEVAASVMEQLPCDVIHDTATIAAQTSIIALEEGQKNLEQMELAQVEDPSLMEQSRSANESAYDRDARRLRN